MRRNWNTDTGWYLIWRRTSRARSSSSSYRKNPPPPPRKPVGNFIPVVYSTGVTYRYTTAHRKTKQKQQHKILEEKDKKKEKTEEKKEENAKMKEIKVEKTAK